MGEKIRAEDKGLISAHTLVCGGNGIQLFVEHRNVCEHLSTSIHNFEEKVLIYANWFRI